MDENTQVCHVSIVFITCADAVVAAAAIDVCVPIPCPVQIARTSQVVARLSSFPQ